MKLTSYFRMGMNKTSKLLSGQALADQPGGDSQLHCCCLQLSAVNLSGVSHVSHTQ